MRTMNRQWTDWGYIDWLEREADGAPATLNVGIVSIAPYAHMNPHIHFTEQVLYTLQGKGYSLLDGKKIDMSLPNQIFHWEASVIHEMYNEGDTEFKHLMVSCPDTVGFDPLISEETNGEQILEEQADEYLRVAIEGTCEQFLDTLHYSYVIFNAAGIPVKRTKVFPTFCCRHCEEELSTNTTACMRHYVACPFTEERELECPHGLTAFYVPILYKGVFLGYVQGGYIHMHNTYAEGAYVTPQSSIQGAQVLLRRIVKAMVNCCEFYQFRNQLMERELALADTRQYQEILIANLRSAENTMIDLKMNNHFLFNTLNQMASMALEGGMVSLYQSILDLSRLFSYAIRNNSNMVLLSKEFEYLDSYLKLQKLRYGKRLRLEYAAQTDLSKWEVPFNFLMPVAENAFTHGFFQEEEKHFYFEVKESNGMLSFVIENNGVGISEEVCRKLEREMKGSTAHGLSMVYWKLQSAFGDHFSIEIFPGLPNGVRVVLRIPTRKSRSEN